MLDGVYKDGGFNGCLFMDDVNGFVQIDGNFNVVKIIFDFNLKVFVKNLCFYDFYLLDKYENVSILLGFIVDFIGKFIDDMNGCILLDSL